MNWLRGLFRLWAILSLLWIAAVIISGAFSDSRFIGSREVLRAPTTEEIEICVRFAKSPSEWCKEPRPFGARVQVIESEAYRYGITALGVPVVVLLLGCGSRWVLTGFTEVDLRRGLRRLVIALFAIYEFGIHAVMFLPSQFRGFASVSMTHFSQNLNQSFEIYAMFALAPPLIAFPLWIAGVWITRGFGPNPQ
jgi:hypothetical protein